MTMADRLRELLPEVKEHHPLDVERRLKNVRHALLDKALHAQAVGDFDAAAVFTQEAQRMGRLLACAEEDVAAWRRGA